MQDVGNKIGIGATKKLLPSIVETCWNMLKHVESTQLIMYYDV